MEKTSFKSVNFEPSDELIYNPYIGFTSFQHFRGEALYSDRISGRDNIAGTETEDYECYPVPEGVAENGRSEGWYPDTTVVYIRSLWKEFEPERKKYNYKFIEDILEKAKSHGQSVMFRLMPHSTCARDDVPDWLKEIIPCPERPDGMRVKDSPTDERFLIYFGEAIREIGKRFDKDETLDCIDVCLPGAWGEGHELSRYSEESLKAFMDIYAEYFPNTKLIGQMASPMMIHHIVEKHPIGYRGDGTGSPVHMTKHFPEKLSKLKPGLWKTAPVSFESYWWMSEWKRQGWDLDAIIENTLNWHISTFNTKSFPIPYEWREKVEAWIKRMGYRFHLSEFTHPEMLIRRKTSTFSVKIENLGVAPIYNKLPLKFKLTNGVHEEIIETNADITKWLPGKTEETITVNVQSSLPVGNYSIYCAIGGNEFPSVKFATKTEYVNAWHYLSQAELV